MITLAGYRAISQIYESPSSLVYRAVRIRDNQPVILKVLKQEYPTTEDVRRYQQEYEITRSLNIDGVVKVYSLEKSNNTPIVILEDFGGDSLTILRKTRSFFLWEFLHFAIEIADILGKIHAANIIHKDINPSNIVLNLNTGELKIIDFGISTIFSQESPALKHPNILEGTLAYISPEQTGRMNRLLDYRTDFYSLGATFYELLTHQLPFAATDAIELVHCHIAKQPVPPRELNPEIPNIVSEIVMKLLAKTAEARYQSTRGLIEDLQNCYDQLQANGVIADFPLGRQDISESFRIPQKLYGREGEIETLLAAFARISSQEPATTNNQQPTTNKREMMLVTGYSGIGKSALVQELYKPITQKRGYFIRGKFDQLQRNIPYYGIVEALRELMRQFLTESETQLGKWRARISTALGGNGQLIIEVIPEVELIIGTQPPVGELPPSETKNRFNLVFQKLIRVLGDRDRPLVIFLDDLQWADLATFQLLESIATDKQARYLFLIGAYRDNEVDAAHPLTVTIDKICQSKTTVNRISLNPLNIEHISHLLADTLHSDRGSVKPLAELAWHKTEGNPFFVNELINTLYSEKILTFARGDRIGWRCDMARIKAIGITDNVVELMIQKLQKLPATTQRVLPLAACVGNQYELTILSALHQKTATDTFQDILPAIQSGLILAGSDLVAADSERITSRLLILDYQFSHDRVQQAASFLVPEERQQEIHLQIGRLLLENTRPEDRDAKIFDIVEHLNWGRELVTNRSQRDEIAKLNLQAGEKAKAAAAYQPALKYFRSGLELLTEETWQTQYELMLALSIATVEAEYLNANFEGAMQLSETVRQQAKFLLDKVKLSELKIQFYIMQNQHGAAIDIAIETLPMLGLQIPENPKEIGDRTAAIQKEIDPKIKQISDLASLPDMKDPYQLAALNILTTAGTAAYLTKSPLFPLFIFMRIKLCIEYGNSYLAPQAYSAYGLFLCGTSNNIEDGYEFGKLAVRLLERFHRPQIYVRVICLFNSFIIFWKEAAKKTLESLQTCYQMGVETGDIEYAYYSAMNFVNHQLLVGENLEVVVKNQAEFLEKINYFKMDFFSDAIGIWRTMAIALHLGDRQQDLEIVDGLNIINKIPVWLEKKLTFLVFLGCCCQTIISYLFSQYERAIDAATLGEEHQRGGSSTLYLAQHNFYYSLTMLAHYYRVDAQTKRRYTLKVKANQKTLKSWANSAPENFQNKYDLVEAERARIKGNILQAMELYDRAIIGARKAEYLHEEAIAYERAAEFYLGLGREEIAQNYMSKSHYCYQRWGANAKAKDLETRYPQLISQLATPHLSNSHTITRTSRHSDGSSAVLDFKTALKASHAISGEILLDRLLNKLMKIIIENAGAQSGSLLLPTDGKWLIEATVSVDLEERNIQKSIPLEESNFLPITAINYVVRTRADVVLSDATGEGDFTQDPYIFSRHLKSLLCTPIIKGGNLIAILYLENNLTTGAFTEERLEILRLLSTQAAISLENALLYANLSTAKAQLEDYSRTLEVKVSDRTKELQEKTGQLESTLNKLQRTQAQLIQTEKMSSLGQMVAGIAHEINNPISFIYGNIKPVENYIKDVLDLIDIYQETYAEPTSDIADKIEEIDLEFITEDLSKILKSMKVGCNRIREIVLSLRNFSRLDESAMKPVDLHAGIESTLLMLQYRLREDERHSQIEVIKEYGELPPITCRASSINQVFLNILNNAIDALLELPTISAKEESKIPTIAIRTEVTDSPAAIVRIADNGPGMTEEVRSHIFDPFFTTKPVGSGTGLGLSISYQIIKQNSGKLSCVSAPGQGTEFIIELPLK